MQFPIWIIEVPHQMPATGWRCDDVTDLAEAAYSAGGDSWQWSDDPAEQDYLDALANDLHGLAVCESLADLIGLAAGYSGHQKIRVRAQARELIAGEIGDKCAQALAGHMAEYRAEG